MPGLFLFGFYLFKLFLRGLCLCRRISGARAEGLPCGGENRQHNQACDDVPLHCCSTSSLIWYSVTRNPSGFKYRSSVVKFIFTYSNRSKIILSSSTGGALSGRSMIRTRTWATCGLI